MFCGLVDSILFACVGGSGLGSVINTCIVSLFLRSVVIFAHTVRVQCMPARSSIFTAKVRVLYIQYTYIPRMGNVILFVSQLFVHSLYGSLCDCMFKVTVRSWVSLLRFSVMFMSVSVKLLNHGML